MPHVMTLKDGKNETIFNFNDVLRLVDQYMGDEPKRWLEAHVGELQQAADYTTVKVDTDLSSYEASLESNRTAFGEILEQLKAVTEQMQSPRVNRQPVIHAVKEIAKIINNQI